MMKVAPISKTINQNDKIWSQNFEKFGAKVYVPHTDLPEDILNFGYSAPCFLVLVDKEPTDEVAVSWACDSGLREIASDYATSVIYVWPVAGLEDRVTGEAAGAAGLATGGSLEGGQSTSGGWKSAPDGIFEEIIENTKIHQYYKDGYAILNNRFFHKNEGFAIRGAIFRTCIIAKGSAADYVAARLIKSVKGAGLWGPADVAPTAMVLENLSALPKIQRRDMPIVSVGNSSEINDFIKENVDDCLIQEKLDLTSAYKNFIRKFKRWGWVGDLLPEPDFTELGMIEEPVVVTLKTSADNMGDDSGTESHKVGYFAYYNKGLFDKGPAPLLLCFHGGGDSAKHIAQVSEWWKVCHDHDFLLICVENHINSTATEMMELLGLLKSKYKIDLTRIYATGFSMGGCKTWDLYQEFPKAFAGLAPMDATFDVGQNVYGRPSAGLGGADTGVGTSASAGFAGATGDASAAPASKSAATGEPAANTTSINQNILVPIFYAGGEETPLPELPCQAEKCRDRMEYVFKVNDCATPYNVRFEDKEKWADKIWGIGGDEIRKFEDKSRNSVLTLNYFKSKNGKIYTCFGSISGQGHECRYHTCEYAWRFMSQFRRMEDGSIEGDALTKASDGSDGNDSADETPAKASSI